jgi:hypothetical protein
MAAPMLLRAAPLLRAAALLAAVAMASAIEIPNIEAKHSYPKRSPDDSALLEWGNSAIIHNADGVVAKFGPGATHPEFELGIEADLVTATPRQGCEPLGNAALARTQIVVMYRGGCDFKTKAETAAAAGAAALIVVNNDRRSPDRAFAMSLHGDRERDEPEERDLTIRTPSLMVSYAAGQQLREHGPRRMRLFAGGERPFIESVTDAQPLLYLVHNAISPDEAAAAKRALAPYLVAAPEADVDDVEGAAVARAARALGALRGGALASFYDRVSSIVGYPAEHLGELTLERRRPGAPFRLKDERKLGPSFPNGNDDARAQTVMTVYAFLDGVDEAVGGALVFPKARPQPIKVQPTAGVAAVFYSALEDGKLDRSAAHGDAPLRRAGAESWALRLRVYDAPRPLARRVILPALLYPIFRGAPSKTLALAARRFFSRFAGDDKADAAIDVALWAVASCGALPFALLGYVAFKAFEKSRTPPKRTKDKKAKKAKKAD